MLFVNQQKLMRTDNDSIQQMRGYDDWFPRPVVVVSFCFFYFLSSFFLGGLIFAHENENNRI